MTIYEVNKILSSEYKSKIISHFWNCKCADHNITHMVKKMNTSQSNLSKHFGALLRLGVLNYKQVGKERFYFLNQKFKNEWKNIVEPQVMSLPNSKYACSCTHK